MVDAKEIKNYSTGLKVLYVEDEPLLQYSTSGILRSFFEKVDVASDGKEGLDLFNANQYDLIYTDLRMPTMDGIEMCREIKKKDFDQSIIVLSAHNESNYLLELINIGVDYFLMKPMDLNQFLLITHKVSKSIYDHKVLKRLQREKEKQDEWERLKLSTAIEQAQEGIIILDEELKIQYSNKAFGRLSSMSQEKSNQKQLLELFNEQNGQGYFNKIWKETVNKGKYRGRVRLLNLEGEEFETDWRISAIKDEEGNTINYACLLDDVTAEVKLEEQLRQTQKMEAIGTLAGGIAHDFNNILSSIILNTSMAREDLSDDAPQQKYLGRVQMASQKAKELIEQILIFSRQKETGFKHINLSEILQEGIRFCRSILPTNIRIDDYYEVEESFVLADSTQILQIILNLCNNASQAIEKTDGLIRVRLMLNNIDHASADLMMLEPGPYVVVEVEDNGAGIGPEHQKRIFDPFFTTKQPGKGTGMGLAVVHGIVKRHRGCIRVESEEGKGTKFTIYLPQTNKTFDSEEQNEDGLGVSQKILLVEYDGQSSADAKSMLERLGHKVLATDKAQEAFEVLKKSPMEFNLIIAETDRIDEQIESWLSNLHEIQTQIPLILAMDIDQKIDDDKKRKMGIETLLPRPVVAQDLELAIANVLTQQTR